MVILADWCVPVEPHDPVSQVVYTAQVNQVRDVWVAGRLQVEDGSFIRINESERLQNGAGKQTA